MPSLFLPNLDIVRDTNTEFMIKNKIYLALFQILCYLLVTRVNERSATQIDATNNIYNTQSIIDE